MNQPSIAELLRRGMEAAQGGNRDGARSLFQQAVAADRGCLEAWLWLGILAETPEQATEHFYQALGVDAGSAGAKAGLEWALAWLSDGVAPPLPSDLEALTRRTPPPAAPEPEPLRIQFDPDLLAQLGSLGSQSAVSEPPAEAGTEDADVIFEQWLRRLRPEEETQEPIAPTLELPSEPEEPSPLTPPAAQEAPPPLNEAPTPPPAALEPPPEEEAPLLAPELAAEVEPAPAPAESLPAEPQVEAEVSPGPSLEELLSRGEAALAEERWDEASTALQEAVAQSPSGESHQQLGLALYRLGQREEALAHFEAALQMEPVRAEPYANLGFIHQELGQLEPAEEYLRQALNRDPALAEARVALAEVLAAQGKLEAAREAWEAAVALRPDLPQLQVGLGDACAALGDRKAAAAAFQRALALQPDLPGVSEKLRAMAEVPLGKRLFGLFSRGQR